MRNDTLIFVDWDDTLIASSWIKREGLSYDRVNDEQRSKLTKLEEQSIALLRELAAFGCVVIMTSASKEWVEQSAQAYLPGIVPVLKEIQVESARDHYSCMFPDDPETWKRMAFVDSVEKYFCTCGDTIDDCLFGSCSFTKTRKFVVSIGDSMHERMALDQVNKLFRNTIGKSIKLIENVDIDTLANMLSLIRQSLSSILLAEEP